MSELDPLLERAFAAARAERPRSPGGKARTLAALGLAGSAACASSRNAATAAGTKGLFARALWSIGLALLATRGETTVFPPKPPPTASVVATTDTAPGGATIRGDEPAADVAAPETISVDALPNAGSQPVTVRAVRRTPILSPAPNGSLRDEIEALERASRALAQRQCALAERHLAAYRAKFPAGRLQGEAAVVEIEIVGRSGQTERARAATRRFVERFPDSPYALRLAPWLNDNLSVVKCADATP
jgi:hypothetical protein